MNKFETKKKLLVAESEVYRQLLKLEFQTFKVYTKRTKRKLTSASTYMPFLMSGLPLIGGLFKGKKKGKGSGRLGRISSLFMLGWQAYQRFAPMFGQGSARDPQPPKTAAEEYLSKRL